MGYKEEVLKDEFTKSMYALKRAEGGKQNEEIDKNAAHLDRISKKLANLKKDQKKSI